MRRLESLCINVSRVDEDAAMVAQALAEKAGEENPNNSNLI